ncbi:MAG: amidohydrolase [Acidobacteria bacterium]|nr:amidohydrolase [Acidobacteriota bacterium]
MSTQARVGITLALVCAVVSCAGPTVDDDKATPEAGPYKLRQTIFYGGDILTMAGDKPQYAEAVVQREGKIVFVGSKDEAIQRFKGKADEIDLAGKTMLPGFIDAHSHVVQQALKFSVVNLDPYPIGDVRTIADIQRKLRDRIEKTRPEPGTWVFGWGYDDTGVEEQRHPTREDLDAASTDHPILLMHISGHLMAANSSALEAAGITEETPDPEGGKIRRSPGGNEPNGVLEETAMAAMFGAIPAPSPERALDMLVHGLSKYAEAGITTAQEGAALPPMLKLLEQGYASGMLPIDIVSYPLYVMADEAFLAEVAASCREYGRYRMGGIKLVLDGSIQGYTAYFSEPYHVQPESGAEVEGDRCSSDAGVKMVLGVDDSSAAIQAHTEQPVNRGFRGYASMTLDQVVTYLRMADDAGVQVLAHTNGDAATDILLEAVGQVRGDRPRPDLRTVIIHAQTMREDQLDAAAAQGLVPSFFPIHVEFWGDRHRDIFLGPERAARIDPARSALDRGMRMTLHHDAPVAGIDILNVVSSAVNRRTSSGKLLGPEQAITPYEALRAVTAGAAWQYFEENRKGTIEEGKLADFVILDKNPLKVDPEALRDLKVIETIKEGETVYSYSR